jgi:hypothetical protein
VNAFVLPVQRHGQAAFFRPLSIPEMLGTSPDQSILPESTMADETQDKTTGKARRSARLAQELRANLLRRKAQARSRDGKPAEGEASAKPEPTPEE